MQILTFLTPEGTTYCATAPRSGSDMAVPDKPADMPLAEFDRDAGEWIEPLAAVKAAKLAEINNGCQAALEALTPTYPERELHSFANQEREAREYQAAPDTAQTPLLSALAAARGIGLAELADKVLAKAAAFATASGHIIGQRQHMEDMLDACGSVEAVQAIAVSYSLPGTGSTGGA